MSVESRPLRATVWRGGARGRLAGIAFLALICAFPLAYMVSLSFSRLGGVLAPGLSVLPQHPTFGNYISAWTENDFSGYFANSIFVAAGTVVGTLVLSSLTAYG